MPKEENFLTKARLLKLLEDVPDDAEIMDANFALHGCNDEGVPNVFVEIFRMEGPHSLEYVAEFHPDVVGPHCPDELVTTNDPRKAKAVYLTNGRDDRKKA